MALTYRQIMEMAKIAEANKAKLLGLGLSETQAEAALEAVGTFGASSIGDTRKAERKAAKEAKKATYTEKLSEKAFALLEADFRKAEDAYKLGHPGAYKDLEVMLGLPNVTGFTVRRILHSIKAPGMTNAETKAKIEAYYAPKANLIKASAVADSPKL